MNEVGMPPDRQIHLPLGRRARSKILMLHRLQMGTIQG
jgi:hypothetical protein